MIKKGIEPVQEPIGGSLLLPIIATNLLYGYKTSPGRFPLSLFSSLLVVLMRRQNDKSFAVLKRLLESSGSSESHIQPSVGKSMD
jgi:hypothetical protein